MRGLSAWRRVLPAAVVLLLTGSVAASAMTSQGFHARRLTLNDGTIWTSQAVSSDANNSGSYVGRANLAAGVIDTAVSAAAYPQLLQDGANVLFHDAASGSVTPIHTQLGTTGKPLVVPALTAPPGTLPVGAPAASDGSDEPRVDLNAAGEVGMGADVAAVVDQTAGRLYLFRVYALPGGPLSAQQPVATVARDSKVVVGLDGITHVVSPTGAIADYSGAGRLVHHADLGADLAKASSPGSPWTVSAVGSAAVVLDGSGGVYVEGSQHPIAMVSGGALLQQPGPASETVLVQTASSLLAVTLANGSTATLAATGSGAPSAPVYVAERGCAYAAWEGSAAVAADASSTGSPAKAPTVAVRCGSRPGYDGPGEDNPVWRVNHGSALLNNEVTGASIYLNDLTPETIADWTQADRPGKESAAVTPSSLTVAAANSPSLPSTVEHPPVANPDVAATRPGLPVIVPVLANDTDPDDDLLSVASVTQPVGGATASIVESGGAVQVTPVADSLTPVSFGYVTDDGRGGTASSTVTVSIHPDSVNDPPVVPVGGAPVTVAAGGRITLDLLQNVSDPDGDAVTLAAATLPAGDGSVSITGAGLAVVSPSVAGAVTLSYTVTDGHGGSTPGTQALLVEAPGTEVPPQAHDDRLAVTVGETTTVDVLANDIDAGPTPLGLASVSAPAGLSVSQPTDGTAAGTLSVRATTAGTSLVRYVATDGTATSPATLRVDAVVAPPAGGAPITTVRDDATLRPAVPTVIPVLANDLDAAGRVLVIDGLAGIPSGLTVTQTDHATLTVRSGQPLASPVSFTYTVGDGVDSATGTVVVRPAPTGIDQPPVTAPGSASVRAGNAIPLDPLADDFDPEGETLTLAGVDPLPAGQGQVFIEANQLRYLAPAVPVGSVPIDYTVNDSAGNSSSGEIVVHVVAVDAPNHPPQPGAVTARVFTGATVTVALPLENSDPDGDVTTLVSVEPASPTTDTLGTVTSPLGLDRFDFTAGATGGTEALSYQVRDSGGLLATGMVHIGVVDPPFTDTAPVALPDSVTIAPGATREVAVLGNDSDADGDPLHLDPAALTRPAAGSATTMGDLVVITAPAGVPDNTTISVGYGITDGRGDTANSTLTEVVTTRPTPAPPVAVDDLTAPQTAGSQVTVPVLANDTVVNGTRAEATVSAIATEGGGPTVTAGTGGTLRFVMPDAPTSFGYVLTDAQGLTSSAVVRVPLAAGVPPVANPDTATTPAGVPVTINLTGNDHDPQGLALSLDGVSPGTGGTVEGLSSTSARFTPAPGFAGLAGFSYTVSDGAGTAAGIVAVAVTQANRVPVVKPLVSKVAAGRSTTLDLTAAATDPDPGDTLVFGPATVSGGTAGVTARITGSTLTLSAAPTAPSGALTVGYAVSDRHGGTAHGTVSLTVIGAKPTRARTSAPPSAAPPPDVPLPQAVPDSASTLAGQPVSVPVLANDVDPLGKGLHLVSVSPAGADGRAVAAGSTVVFTPAGSFHGVAALSYVLADASGDPNRQATGTLRISVIGRPDAPGVPSGVPGNGQVTLRWSTPAANGGHISGYTVHFGVSLRSCKTTSCVITGLPNGHAYTFTVTATDEAGTGPASGPSAALAVDVAPSPPLAPLAVAGDRSATVSWPVPASPGSSIAGYTVLASPGGITIATPAPTATFTGLTNGTAYTFTVTATNRAGTSAPSPPSAAVTPAAGPGTPTGLRAAASAAGTTVTATWAAADPMGSPVTSYHVHEYVDNKYTRTLAIKDASVLKLTVGSSLGHLYAFTVAATNALGSSAYSPESAAVRAAAKPAQVASVKATAGNGRATLTWTAPAANGEAISSYVVTPSTGAAKTFTTAGATFTGLTNGKAYTFRVSACNTQGCGPASAASNAVTPAAPAKPKAKP